MRNVTISLDDDLARSVRVRAAQCDKSVSRYIADLLRRDAGADVAIRTDPRPEAPELDEAYKAAMKAYFAIPGGPISEPGIPYPKREELYDRAVFRRYESPGL
jgi:hypothetical protein